MSKLLQWLGIKVVAFGYDFNACLVGIKYDDDEGCVEDDPEGKVLFFFLGPFHIFFVV